MFEIDGVNVTKKRVSLEARFINDLDDDTIPSIDQVYKTDDNKYFVVSEIQYDPDHGYFFILESYGYHRITYRSSYDWSSLCSASFTLVEGDELKQVVKSSTFC